MEITVARKRLEEMRDELDRSIAILQGERPAPLAGEGYPHDPADAGSTLSETDRTEAILDSARSQRTGVLSALARIDDNTYGRCVDCGVEIPEGRLDARPDAARCVNCQAKRARRRLPAAPVSRSPPPGDVYRPPRLAARPRPAHAQ